MTEQRFDIIYGFSPESESTPARDIPERIAWQGAMSMFRHEGGYCKVRAAGADGPWTTIRSKRKKLP